MDSKNSGTSDPHRRLLNLTDKINLKRSGKYFALSNLNNKNNIKNKQYKKQYKI